MHKNREKNAMRREVNRADIGVWYHRKAAFGKAKLGK